MTAATNSIRALAIPQMSLARFPPFFGISATTVAALVANKLPAGQWHQQIIRISAEYVPGERTIDSTDNSRYGTEQSEQEMMLSIANIFVVSWCRRGTFV